MFPVATPVPVLFNWRPYSGGALCNERLTLEELSDKIQEE